MIELCGWAEVRARGMSVSRAHGVKAVAGPDGNVTSACARGDDRDARDRVRARRPGAAHVRQGNVERE